MAIPTCVKCQSHTFEVVHQEPAGSEFKIMFVQCASCGSVVGVMDYYNIGETLNQLAKALNIDLNT